MKQAISFNLNGELTTAEVEPQRRLIDVLREDLHLTGTKEGCGTGHCGSCHVLVDGAATRSCHTPVKKVAGKTVTTIEGLGSPSHPHPIQEAFVKKGAVQCGFCTPGMVMATKALLDSNPDPSVAEIAQALSNNLCRCTGYSKIIEAVQEAARLIKGGAASGPMEAGVPQLEALEKATGSIKYAADLEMEGMVHAKVLRSPHAHALITHIDTSAAEVTPGVLAVLTARDVPGANSVGWAIRDEPVLAEGKVRHVGEPVAAVAATSVDIARDALKKIEVQYEALPDVFDPLEALKKDAPQVHEGGNLLDAIKIARGDVEAGFHEADVVLEQVFTTPWVEHAYLEPEAGLAYIDEEGRIVISSPAQDPINIHQDMARVLGLDLNRVRIVHTNTGGAFGGKHDVATHGILAILALKLKRPVKLVYTRRESLEASTKRHPFRMNYKVGAKLDGRLTSLKVDFVSNSGAYASLGPVGMGNAAKHATGPYYFPNVLIEGKIVYTNGPVGGAMRGLGVPQVHFAIESMVDMLARRLDIDALKFRRINALGPGAKSATGQVLMEGLGLKPSLDSMNEHYSAAKRAADAERAVGPGRIMRGVGLASASYGLGIIYAPDNSETAVELTPAGGIRIYLGGPELGQGSNTVMAQIAAAELHVPLSSVSIVTVDTAVTPNTGGSYHSRQTYRAGNAILDACRNLKELILQTACQVMGLRVEDLRLVNGGVVMSDRPSVKMSFAEAAARILEAGGSLTQHGAMKRPVIKLNPANGQGDAYDTWTFCTHVAEVEVNTETGEVRVIRVTADHNPGRAINMLGVEGQIQGAIMMGLGWALTEEFIPEHTHNLGQYRMPTTLDMPEIQPVVRETVDPTSPFGAVGLGEIPLYPVAPAIANAIYDACGVRLTDLPLRVPTLQIRSRW